MRNLVLLLCLFMLGCSTSSTAGSAPQDAGSPGSASSDASSVPSQSVRTPSAPTTSPASRPSREPAGTTIIAAKSQFGTILYDASGQPIYLFDAEATSRPKCYGECAEAWPPVLTKGKPQAKGAVRDELLGTTRRSDGSTQITYADHPLYFYAHEGKYEVLCHNVTEFGGTWLVVQPNGKPPAT
jgi:predicted lipoprotein with Yx(FWY)xxD motif